MTEFEAGVHLNEDTSQVKQIGERVSGRLQARREEARAQGLDYDHLTDADPVVFGAREATTDLQTRVRELNAMSGEVWVSLAMQDRQLPFFIRFLSQVERLLHKLVVKYVNQLAGRQLVFNKDLAGTMASIVDRLEQIAANQTDLQNRLSVLEERLADPHSEQKTTEGKDRTL